MKKAADATPAVRRAPAVGQAKPAGIMAGHCSTGHRRLADLPTADSRHIIMASRHERSPATVVTAAGFKVTGLFRMADSLTGFISAPGQQMTA